jgi:hypothetical protein
MLFFRYAHLRVKDNVGELALRAISWGTVMVRRMVIYLALIGAFSSIFSSTAIAKYIATGPVIGNVCSFGGFVCSFHSIDAVKGEDGKLYHLNRVYDDVSDYKPLQKKCWIQIKSKGLGFISRGINLFTNEFFERKPNGSYEEIDVEYLVFDCEKVK